VGGGGGGGGGDAHLQDAGNNKIYKQKFYSFSAVVGADT